MASIFSKAVAIVEGIAHSAQSLLVKIFGQSAVDSVETTMSTIFKEDVLTIFSDAVTAAESLQVDGVAATSDQKRQAAFQQVSTDLKTAGVSLGENAINMGIELVVGFLKGKAAAISAPATGTPVPTPAPAAS